MEFETPALNHAHRQNLLLVLGNFPFFWVFFVLFFDAIMTKKYFCNLNLKKTETPNKLESNGGYLGRPYSLEKCDKNLISTTMKHTL